MRGKEIIVLDAVITNVINMRAFRAQLGNGHELIAYVPRMNASAQGVCCAPGGAVRVAMTPFDMARGEIVEVLKTKAET